MAQEFSCESCKSKQRVEVIRIVDVNCIVGDSLITVPTVMCLNEVCVQERGGNVRSNAVSMLPKEQINADGA